MVTEKSADKTMPKGSPVKMKAVTLTGKCVCELLRAALGQLDNRFGF
jgi:hypothetical protein